MSSVEAVYQGGVFKPLGDVNLAENQRVRLDIRPLWQQSGRVQAQPLKDVLNQREIRPLEGAMDPLAWLEMTARHQQEFIDRHGYLPDSTPDIAEDRMRDV